MKLISRPTPDYAAIADVLAKHAMEVQQALVILFEKVGQLNDNTVIPGTEVINPNLQTQLLDRLLDLETHLSYGISEARSILHSTTARITH